MNKKEMAVMLPATEIPDTNREYKDSLFRMIFRSKEELLSLYNAVNGTDYQNPEELTVNTLENAIYMGMKNDVSFLINGRMYLYEQQSTYCPNMPLRDLFYVSRLYQKEMVNRNLYSSKLVKIPTPKFITFYIGTKEMPARQVLKLSDSYLVKEDEPDLELKVLMLNINSSQGKELLEKCRTLKDYVTFVEKVRKYRETMSIENAAEYAVQECIRDGVLAEFLKKYRAEAIAMNIFEYDFDEHMRLVAEEAREDAYEEARQEVEEANRQKEEANRQREEANRQKEEANRQKEEANRQKEEAEAKYQKRIAELEEKLRQVLQEKE